MTCKLDKGLLYSFTDSTIDPLEKIFVEEHLKYCEECREELKAIQSIDRELDKFNFEVDIPYQASILSHEIVEKYIDVLEKDDIKLKRHNYKQDMKILRKIILLGCSLSYNNIYNKFIFKGINKFLCLVNKPLKQCWNRYWKKTIKSKGGWKKWMF